MIKATRKMSKHNHAEQKKPAILNDVQASRCPMCNSTERTGYNGIRFEPIAGEQAGKPYNRIYYKYCSCVSCGQVRVDKSYELIPNDGS